VNATTSPTRGSPVHRFTAPPDTRRDAFQQTGLDVCSVGHCTVAHRRWVRHTGAVPCTLAPVAGSFPGPILLRMPLLVNARTCLVTAVAKSAALSSERHWHLRSILSEAKGCGAFVLVPKAQAASAGERRIHSTPVPEGHVLRPKVQGHVLRPREQGTSRFQPGISNPWHHLVNWQPMNSVREMAPHHTSPVPQAPHSLPCTERTECTECTQ
jgi:hypothetical protein